MNEWKSTIFDLKIVETDPSKYTYTYFDFQDIYKMFC